MTVNSAVGFFCGYLSRAAFFITFQFPFGNFRYYTRTVQCLYYACIVKKTFWFRYMVDTRYVFLIFFFSDRYIRAWLWSWSYKYIIWYVISDHLYAFNWSVPWIRSITECCFFNSMSYISKIFYWFYLIIKPYI